MANVSAIRKKIQSEGEKGDDAMEGIGGMIFTIIFWINEIIDYAGLILNVTGAWEIIILIIDFIVLALFVLYLIMQGKIKCLFNWKVVLSLIVEHIPIVGDIFPGWLTTKHFLKKKKG
jgi:hypothetical protein